MGVIRRDHNHRIKFTFREHGGDVLKCPHARAGLACLSKSRFQGRLVRVCERHERRVRRKFQIANMFPTHHACADQAKSERAHALLQDSPMDVEQ